MLEFYETFYQIHNHEVSDVNRPLSSVAFHRGEDTLEFSLLKTSMKRFVDSKIKDLFGLSYLELINHPTEIVELYYEVADDKIKRDQTLEASIKNQMKNAASRKNLGLE